LRHTRAWGILSVPGAWVGGYSVSYCPVNTHVPGAVKSISSLFCGVTLCSLSGLSAFAGRHRLLPKYHRSSRDMDQLKDKTARVWSHKVRQKLRQKVLQALPSRIADAQRR